MLIQVLKSKIHRMTVTHADLEYEGSITLDQSVMEAAGLYENEKVDIWNVTNGNRIATYAMAPGEPGSGLCCINGAAAHLMNVGDVVIIASYGMIDVKDRKSHKPLKVVMDAKNKIKVVKHT